MLMPDKADSAPKHHAMPSSAAPEPAEGIDAADLLRGASEVLIRHAGQIYRLRVTRANKLLLIK